MTNERRELTRHPHQEVLPPESGSVSFAPEVSHLPRGALGISLLARARYASEQKQIEAYTSLVHAKHDLIRALAQQKALAGEYVAASEALHNLDAIRAAARLDIHNRLSEKVAAGIRLDNEIERLQIEREQLRQRREALSAPAPAPAASQRSEPTPSDTVRKISATIEEFDLAIAEAREKMICEAGGEEHLPESKRRFLKQLEVVRDQVMHDTLQKLV